MTTATERPARTAVRSTERTKRRSAELKRVPLEDFDAAPKSTARILLAEDDVEMRCLLAWGLEEEGYVVDEAENGLDLLKKLQPSLLRAKVLGTRIEYDLIVSDIRMPGLSGLEVLAGLRKYDQTTPYVVITAFGDYITHAEASALGASAVIDKPFEIDDLRQVVRRLLSTKS